MSDIHQEWNELRQKNGDFINHLDGEMTKLKQDKQLQDLLDSGAFAMQFIAPPQFNCCQDDRDILKALNKAQADRIKYLEDEFLACKEQQRVDQAVKKDLDEKLDKATADYRALWVENDRLKSQLASEKAQSEAKIKQLTGENEGLRHDNNALAEGLSDQTRYAIDLMSTREDLKREIETLHGALDIAAKDADANFERGKIKGMEEIWQELRDCYDGRPTGENEKIFGYCTVGEIVGHLSPTWFMNKAEEYHKQKEKEALNVQIGDEVWCFDLFFPDDDPHSDIGIVVIVDSERHSYVVVGPNFEGCFDETDIQSGAVKKTGRHFDSIPLDYFA